MKYTVIKDTREQRGWHFISMGDCIGMENKALKTGDYSLKGYEEFITIERKRSVEEIATNIGKKSKPFEAEMQRMSEIQHAYILCEFNVEELLNFPNSSTLSKKITSQVRITGSFILKRLLEYQMKYNVKIIFCGSSHNAFVVAASIFKRMSEQIDGKF